METSFTDVPKKGPKRKHDLHGRTFGFLTVISFVGKKEGKGFGQYWSCRCICGKVIDVVCANLIRTDNHKTHSCGCRRNFSHGRTRDRNSEGFLTYSSYKAAQNRCNNPKDKSYKYYGGRGIEFRFKDIEELVAAIGERPGKEYSIDRINNDGHYEVGNVRWVLWKTQTQNKRPAKSPSKRRSRAEMSKVEKKIKGTPKVDLVGQIFGKLTVIACLGQIKAGRKVYWECRCECGNTTVVWSGNLKDGRTKSCGCLKTKKLGYTNKNHPSYLTYRTYQRTLRRCTNGKEPGFMHYGGAGVKFRFTGVEQLISDIGERPGKEFTLERKLKKGHFEPGNVEWIRWTENTFSSFQ